MSPDTRFPLPSPSLTNTTLQVAWSIIYIPVVTWGLPRVPARFLPNVIVLVFECLSWLWWLTTFAMMATWLSLGTISASIIASYSGSYMLAKRNPYDSDSYSSSSSYSSTYDDVLDAAEDVADDYTSSVNSALGASKAATAFAAITW